MNMLEKVQSQLEHLSKSERKVADIYSQPPGQIDSLKALPCWRETTLAEPATVSVAA